MTPQELADMQVALLRAAGSDQSRVRGARVPFIGPGRHQALVESLSVQAKDGKTVVWLQSVLTSSDREECPKLVASYYDLTSPAKFPNSPSGADLFTALIRAVTGAPDDGRLADGSSNPKSELAATLRAVLIDRVSENILRGMAYAVSGAYGKESKDYALVNGRQYKKLQGLDAKGEQLIDHDKERFVYISVSSIEQTDAEVATSRAWLDEHYPRHSAGASTQAAAPVAPAATQPPPAASRKFVLPGRSA